MQAVNWYNVITWGIIHSLWQGALISLLCWLILLSTKKVSANFRYIISCCGLFSMLGLFLYQIVQRYNTIHRIEKATEAIQQQYGQVKIAFTNIQTNEIEGWLQGLAQYSSLITALYTLGLSFMVIKLSRSYYLLRQIRQTAQPAHAQLQQLLQEYSEAWRITRPLQLSVSAHITSPATWGWLKPLILFPAATVNHLSTTQLEAILLHELAHIRRHDYLVNVLQSVTETLLFFNPFALWLSRQIRTEREHCCDEWVSAQTDPVQYAESLLSVAMLQNNMPATAIGLFTDKHQLFTRIKRITSMNTQHPAYLRKIAAAVVAAGIIVSIAWVAPQDSAAKKQKTVIKEEKTATTIESAIELEKAMRELESSLQTLDHQAVAADVSVSVNGVSEMMKALPLEQITDLALSTASTTLDATDIVNWDKLENMVTSLAATPEEAEEARADIRKSKQEAAKAMQEARIEIRNSRKEIAAARAEIANIDWKAINKEIAEAQKEAGKYEMEKIDWKAINKEIAEAQKEAMAASLESRKEAFAKADEMMKEAMAQQKEALANADVARENAMAFAKSDEAFKAAMAKQKETMANAEIASKNAMAAANKAMKKYGRIMTELKKDGLVKNIKNANIQIQDDNITVNGKPLPDNLKPKYKELLKED